MKLAAPAQYDSSQGYARSSNVAEPRFDHGGVLLALRIQDFGSGPPIG